MNTMNKAQVKRVLAWTRRGAKKILLASITFVVALPNANAVFLTTTNTGVISQTLNNNAGMFGGGSLTGKAYTLTVGFEYSPAQIKYLSPGHDAFLLTTGPGYFALTIDGDTFTVSSALGRQYGRKINDFPAADPNDVLFNAFFNLSPIGNSFFAQNQMVGSVDLHDDVNFDTVGIYHPDSRTYIRSDIVLGDENHNDLLVLVGEAATMTLNTPNLVPEPSNFLLLIAGLMAMTIAFATRSRLYRNYYKNNIANKRIGTVEVSTNQQAALVPPG